MLKSLYQIERERSSRSCEVNQFERRECEIKVVSKSDGQTDSRWWPECQLQREHRSPDVEPTSNDTGSKASQPFLQSKDKVRWTTHSERLLKRFLHETKRGRRTGNNTGQDATQQCQKHGVHTKRTRRKSRQNSVRHVNVHSETQSTEKGCRKSFRCSPSTLGLTTGFHTMPATLSTRRVKKKKRH